MKISKLTSLFLLSGMVLFFILSVLMFKQELKRPALPRVGEVLPFELIDEGGRPFNSKSLQGNVWVANFFFTTCADVCPMLSKNMASLARSYDLLNDVKFISFSVNPEQDNPEALKQYAQKLKAKKDKWFFLTGSREKLTEVALKSFKIGSVEEPIFHSAYFCLVDRRGVIRGYYEGMKQTDVNKLFKDISKLLKER